MPYGRFGFIPRLRYVEDYPEDLEVADVQLEHDPEALKLVQEEAEVSASDVDSIAKKLTAKANVKVLEYRDEANRPWWKFFDEYEYRLNKYERKKHKWWYWFDEGTSKEEKKLIIKLDFLIAFYVFVVYWVKALDSSNLANAYVSEMKEHLNFQGNDYINTQTVFNVANVVFQIPAMYLFPRFPLHLYLPALDVCWGLFTLGSYRCNTVGQIQAMRFFVGAFEASAYPCSHYLFGSWYKGSELGFRGMLFYWGQMLGTISSGLFQARIYQNLDGVNGLAGWRWMFIIDAIVSIPVGLFGFFCVPGTPFKCYSIWLSDDEIRLARSRLIKANVKPPPANPPPFFDKKLWTKVFGTWKVYVLTLFSIGCWNNSSTAGSGYILWVKSLKRYSIPKVNNLSCIPPGVGFALIAIVCGGADMFRSRYGAIIASQLLNIISNLILTIWDVPESAKWFAFSILYAGWCQASVMYGFCNDILRLDPQERAITFILFYMTSQSTSIWITRLVWPTVDAPRFHVGYSTTLAFAVYLILMCFVVLFFYKKQEKSIARDNGIVLYNSSVGDIPEEVQEYLNSEKKNDLDKKESISI